MPLYLYSSELLLLSLQVSGGPYGVENVVGAGGPLLAILGFLIFPLVSCSDLLVTFVNPVKTLDIFRQESFLAQRFLSDSRGGGYHFCPQVIESR